MDLASTAKVRLHDLDAMRSVLMLLGVLLHAANPYRVDSRWLIADPPGNSFFDLLVASIHSFRMPAFFVVAGYFAMFSLMRRSTREFAVERSVRLLLPCLVTLVVINIPQHLFLAGSPPGSTVPADMSLGMAWWAGELVGHLWFLVILAVYCLVVAMVAPAARKLGNPLRTRMRPGAVVAAMIAAGIILPLAIRTALSILGAPVGMFMGLFNISEFIEYAPYFIAGLLLRGTPSLLERFRRPEWLGLMAGAAALLSLSWLDRIDGRLGSAALLVAGTLVTWTMVRLCFAFFHWAASQESATFRYLSEASYSIYLFHHVVVILMASVVFNATLGAGAKFMLVLFVASAVSLAVHEYAIRRSGLLTWLFNGRKPRTVR